ncbi:3-hydroxyacyl-ACP dehydratase [Taibaiella sp. KBW10]|nr:3-hydroxyacyl-ACP dehydratase [Taibaiella sp. KBW10]
MIDEIISANEQQTTSSFLISQENIFVANGVFTEPGLIENMAQTAAAGTGYKAALENTAPPVGFIGQVKQLNISQLPKVGDTLQTTITNIQQVMNAFIVKGTILCAGQEIASAEYKIFLQEN